MPSGLPDVDDLDALGGVKSDYAPVEDTTTDLSADYWNLVAMNVAGMTQTVARCWCAIVGKASSPPDDPVSNVHGAVWGDDLSDKPTTARTTTGVYTFTWAATVTDELTEEHTTNLRRAWAAIDGATPYIITATVTSSNVVTVRVFDAAGVANDAVGATITVFAV